MSLPTLRTGKRMRKGTRSCVECRRRKVRCIKPHGSSICTSCHNRGSRCIDQRGVGEPYSSGNVLHNGRGGYDTNADGLIPGNAHEGEYALAEMSRDIDTSLGFSAHLPPLVSILESRSIEVNRVRAPRSMALDSLAKDRAICENLRSFLPSFDRLSDMLAENGSWWDSFREKTRVISQAGFEHLATFAAKAYTSMKPAEVGMLAVAYARSLYQGFHELLPTVERLILSDMSYAATADGMLCLILLGKIYTDIGHPRRAWLVWRRGVSVSQLMGYHRESCVDPAKKGAWWAAYHGDRFTSMLLGLPHGCSDSILEPQFKDAANTIPAVNHFTHRCAVVAGRIVERNTASIKLPYSELMSIDEEMDGIADLMPPSWWDVPDNLSHIGIQNSGDLRGRLLLQFYFFHVRMHLHLPSIARSETIRPAAAVSKLACIVAARQLLKRCALFNMSTSAGQRLFDCKTSRFVAFTGAVVLALGVYHMDGYPHSILGSQEDERLLQSIDEVFRDEEQRRNCNISTQCRIALGALFPSGADGRGREGESNTSANGTPSEIYIPYFGKILRLYAVHSASRRAELSSQPTASETLPSLPVLAAPRSPEDCWTYQYPEKWIPLMQDTDLRVDDSHNNPFSQLDILEMDLDWDWASSICT